MQRVSRALLLARVRVVAVLMVLAPRVRQQSVVKPLHRPQSHVCILGVPRLQLFVGGVVGVGEL